MQVTRSAPARLSLLAAQDFACLICPWWLADAPHTLLRSNVRFCRVQGYQVDWEAILSRSPEPFIASVSAWLYPPAARGDQAAEAPTLASAPNPEQLPPVRHLLGTARWRLQALNMP